MTLRYKIVSVVALLAGVFLWGRCSTTKPRPTVPVPATVLPKDDKEQLIIDPSTHHLTIVTAAGPRVITLPDRPSVIDLRKNGDVHITSPQIGFEVRPFVGLGFGQGFRAYAGADLGYWKRADLGAGIISPKLGGSSYNDFRIGLFGSYNVYSNTRITLGYDTSKTLHALISVRI